MKRRKIKISIIPHNTDNVKVSKIFIIIFPIVILLLFILSIYLVSSTVINIKSIKDYKSIKKLKEETAILTIKDRESKRTIKEIENKINKLKNKTKEIIPQIKFFSGFINTAEDDINLPIDLDSLYQLTQNMREDFDTVFHILSNKSYASKIPSIVPVNGWVLRYYGKVMDPYTETERFSPGILFVANYNGKVFASADGYIVFAGSKPKLGKTVIIKHGKDFTTTYAHLGKIIVQSGKSIKKGTIIGYVGKSGKTLSSSLYYEIKFDDKAIDPLNSFLIPVYSLYDTLRMSL